jgi:hypothetical protein
MNWSNLPHEVIYQKILPLLPIDTKLSLKVKPKKLSNNIIENLQTEINKIKNKPFITRIDIENKNILFLQIRKHIINKIYIHWRIIIGSTYDEYIYTEHVEPITNTWQITNTWYHNAIRDKWEIQIY